MPTGKTPARYTQVLIDGVDVSSDSSAISMSGAFGGLDATGLSDPVRGDLDGIPELKVDGKFWFDNTALTGSHAVLKNAGTWHTIAIPNGVRAVPAPGDACFAARLFQPKYAPDAAIGTALGSSASFDGEDPAAPALDTPWGVLLHANTQETVTTNGTIIDGVAASTGGALGFLHVTAVGGVWTIIIQHDTAAGMGTATTLMTFTSNGSTVTSEVQSATGTVNRYTRAVMTKTSGNFTGLIALVRG